MQSKVCLLVGDTDPTFLHFLHSDDDAGPVRSPDAGTALGPDAGPDPDAVPQLMLIQRLVQFLIAGPGPDVGPDPDSDHTDALCPDAGPDPNAGPQPDAGPDPDASPDSDAGPSPDAGPGSTNIFSHYEPNSDVTFL